MTLRLLSVALVISTLAFGADGKSAVVVLRWEPVSDAQTYELQVAADAEFTGELALEVTVDVAGYRWRSLPTQTMYWRVRSVDAEGRKGPWSRINKLGVAVSAPVIAAPPADSVLSCRDRCVFTVSADPDALVEQYVFEWWPEADEAQVQTRTSPSPQQELEVSGPGRYLFRIGAVDLEGRRVAPGAPRRVELLAQAPEPSRPLSDSTVGASLPGTVELAWSSRSGADSQFDVELKDPAGAVRRLSADKSPVQALVERYGKHAFRVRSRTSGFSPWSAFTVGPAAAVVVTPRAGERFTTRGSSRRVTFSWEGSADAAWVELSSDGGFEGRQRVRVTRGAPTLDVPIGLVAFQLTTEAPDGTSSPPSAPRWIEVIGGESLEVPALQSPSDSEYVDAPKVTARWSNVPHAVEYELAVAAKPGAFEPLAVTSGLTLDVPMPAKGSLLLRVRARDEDGSWSDWSPVREAFRGEAPSLFSRVIGSKRSVRLGASAGYATNLGAVGGPLLQLDASVRTPLLDRRVLVLARAGTLTASPRLPTQDRAGVRWTSFSSLAAFEQQVGPVGLYVGAGPQAAYTTVQIVEQSESRWTVGGVGALGAVASLGAGVVRSELSLGFGRADGEVAAMRTGLLAFTLGYAWEP